MKKKKRKIPNLVCRSDVDSHSDRLINVCVINSIFIIFDQIIMMSKRLTENLFLFVDAKMF